MDRHCVRRDHRHRLALAACVFVALAASCGGSEPRDRSKSKSLAVKSDPREVHLANVQQLTRGVGENAEAYWSFDGEQLSMQSKRHPFSCDQIYRLAADGSRTELVSNGLGRTTCAHFLPGDEEVVYSSTKQAGDSCPPEPDRSQGYVWPIYPSYDIYVKKLATDQAPRKLTNSPGYDAEATVCRDGSIVFTSTRNGDLDLYRMDRDGSNVVQLTNTPGYDGGAFFSQDCSQIVWRASRPQGEALTDYRRLLSRNLVRPGKLEIFVANADGSNPRQLTYLDAASFAPYFHPSGKRVLFSTNFHPDAKDPRKAAREFDIWAINTDGTDLEQITFAEGFDSFPMFSPDGSKLAFSSNRNNAKEGETDVYVADWVDSPPLNTVETGAEEFLSDVAWLADNEREGRGVGTKGIEASADWLAERFEEMGLEPAGENGYFQTLDVTTSVALNPDSQVAIAGKKLSASEFSALGFAAEGKVQGKAVFAGYGIHAPQLGVSDFEGLALEGNVAVVRRYVPESEVFRDRKIYDQYSSLHRKAFEARERGAVAVIVVNGPPPGEEKDAELPVLELDRLGGGGIPVISVASSFLPALQKKNTQVRLDLRLDRKQVPSRNVVGVLRAGAKRSLGGYIVVGAHYDHLGYGDRNSLSGGDKAVHNGADDNASGVAGLLFAARKLGLVREDLQRDVVFAAFTGEEKGLLGSKYFVETYDKTVPKVGKDSDGQNAQGAFAMLNMDMIGRMRNNKVAVLGAATAKEWSALAKSACDDLRVLCTIGGDGYGPSDHSSFTAAKVPVLYVSTLSHSDYHKPSDDTETINAAGGRRISELVTALSFATANLESALSYQSSAAPSQGDRRSFGASLGTIPDYSGDTSKPGMLISGVRPGGAADKAGLAGGDRILAIDDTELKSVRDLVYVLQSAKPGEEGVAKVERNGKILMLQFTYQKSQRRK